MELFTYGYIAGALTTTVVAVLAILFLNRP